MAKMSYYHYSRLDISYESQNTLDTLIAKINQMVREMRKRNWSREDMSKKYNISVYFVDYAERLSLKKWRSKKKSLKGKLKYKPGDISLVRFYKNGTGCKIKGDCISIKGIGDIIINGLQDIPDFKYCNSFYIIKGFHDTVDQDFYYIKFTVNLNKVIKDVKS